MGIRHYYAVESTFGFVSIWSEYGQPTLHVFNSKKERDEYVQENDVLNGNINHRCWEVKADSKRAYRSRWNPDELNNVVYHE